MPGPAIGYLQACLRWFDHWMRGADNGIMHAPKLHAWVAEDVPATASYPESPGRWDAEADWTPAGLSPKRLHLPPGKLEDEPGPAQPDPPPPPQHPGPKARA